MITTYVTGFWVSLVFVSSHIQTSTYLIMFECSIMCIEKVTVVYNFSGKHIITDVLMSWLV